MLNFLFPTNPPRGLLSPREETGTRSLYPMSTCAGIGAIMILVKQVKKYLLTIPRRNNNG